jgi:hypothetical protein
MGRVRWMTVLMRRLARIFDCRLDRALPKGKCISADRANRATLSGAARHGRLGCVTVTLVLRPFLLLVKAMLDLDYSFNDTHTCLNTLVNALFGPLQIVPN